jgi:serine/threonine protein kinase/Tfp pilus assembly protein PilF
VSRGTLGSDVQLSDDAVMAELLDELANRLQAGEPVDPEALAAAHPEHGERLRRLLPAALLLAELEQSDQASVPAATHVTDKAPDLLGDFRLVRELGRGGMGIVYEAEQVSLARRVALKVLPFAATMDPRQLQRFHNEARAAAGLHHTNIVPVYGVGCERGVHYYAMQLIEGRTLADFIAQQQGTAPVPTMAEAGAAPTVPQAAQATSVAPRDAAYFRRAAEWGIQSAEALDCAHALGVVHRDVKPANLMVDVTGRLWVTDFGLVQMQNDARLTMSGDLVGTLRYMSPEQALAKRVVLDHRTDVYSLGATLYELLTLQPAFDGKDRQELLRQIAFEEPRPPRRINKPIPAELDTIVLKALEKNPAERYATAQDLADDLRRYLNHETIRARRASLVQRARKWARRHRAVVAATLICLMMALAAGVGSVGWVLGERKNRQREAEGRVWEALKAAAPGLKQGNPEDPALLEAMQRAVAQLDSGVIGPELRVRVEQCCRDVEMLRRLEKACLQSAAGGKETGFDYAGADRLYAEAFAWYGLDVTALEPEEAARRVRASALSSHLTAALDFWAFVRDKVSENGGSRLQAVADLADGDPWRRRLRSAVRGGDRDDVERLAEEKVLSQPAAYLVLLARHLKRAGSGAPAERLLRRAQAAHPADFWINFELESVVFTTKSSDPAERVRFLQTALALRPQSPVVYSNLGAALQQQGKLVEAVAAFRKAIQLKPDFDIAHYNLANALRDQKKWAEAEAACRKVVELEPDLPDLAVGYNNLGVVLASQQRLDEAVAAFQRATQLKTDYAGAYKNLGRAMKEQGRLQEAVVALEKAVKIKRDYAEAYYMLGNTLRDQRKPKDAEVAYRQAIKVKPDYAEAHCNLGWAQLEQGRCHDALDSLRLGHGLGSPRPAPAWPYRSAEWVRAAERFAVLADKLPMFLSGEAQPANVAESIALAQLCHFQKKEHGAACFYARAFAAQPALAADLNNQNRYNAACTAALAGCRKGEDASQLKDKECAGLRKQALDWLRADLAGYTGLLGQGFSQNNAAVQHRLRRWQQDAYLANVRGDALARLPESERKAWQKLWADVAATLARAVEQVLPRKKLDLKSQ